MKDSNSLIEGSIPKGLIGLAIPIIATNFIQTAYNMVDMIWVSRLGSKAVAAVGTATFFVSLAFSLLELVSTGSGIRISQSIGAKKNEETKNLITNAFIMSSILAIIYSTTIIIFKEEVIGFFNLRDYETEQNAIIYLTTSMVSVIFMYLNAIFITIFNSFGNSRLPFIINTIGFLLNLLLDPILIFGFLNFKPLGVFGAALATAISRILVLILFVINSRQHIKILKSDIRFDYKKSLDTIIVGVPYALQRILFTVIGIAMAKIISSWGATAIAVQKIGVQIEAISYMAIAGLNNAMRTFVGQNYGANNLNRIKTGYNIGLLISTIFGLMTTSLLVFFPKEIFSLFLKDSESLSMGIKYLKIIGYSQVFMCIEIISSAAFNGIGKTYIPSIISITFTSLRIPMAIFLSGIPLLGLDGVWWTISISSIIKGLLLMAGFLLYAKYRLKDMENKTIS